MKPVKLIFVLFALSIGFNAFEIRAQDSRSPKQIRILNNYGAIPFEDDKTVIAEVVFTGLDPEPPPGEEVRAPRITEQRALQQLNYKRVSASAGLLFYGARIARSVKVLREWLAELGYRNSEVTAFGEVVSKDEMRLVFEIKRGSLIRVSEVRFDGLANLTNGELAENWRQCVGNNGLEIFEQRKYANYLRRCSLSYLYGKGFLRAKIGAPEPEMAAGNYVVGVPVEEGARFRWGTITISGAKALTEKEILEMFGQKEGEVADGKKTQDFVFERLKKAYAERGYLLYNGELDYELIEPQVKTLDGTVNLEITIDEGARFSLAKIDFSGVDETEARKLRALFDLADGAVYNQSAVDQAVKKINELKEYYSIDPEADIEMRTDEENFGVHLVVKLTKIEQ